MRSILFVPFLALAAVAAPAADLVEGIVVRVNDRILTTADMHGRILEREAEMGRPVPPEAYPEIVKEAANELVLLERADELKIDVSDEEVDAAVAQLREQNRVEDAETFERMLATMGLSVGQLRTRLRETILVNRVMQREVGQFPITEEELRQRYEREKQRYRIPEQVHLEHLVLPGGGTPDERDAALARASGIVAAVRDGADFQKLIEEETAASAATGGDLGTIALADLRDEVRKAVENLKAGQVADAFASPAGIHVVRVVERTPATARPFAEVVEQVRQDELADRYRARLTSVVGELQKRYVVEVRPELMKAVAD